VTRLALIAATLLLSACSQESGTDIPPLPEESADSANALMREAEGAAANAQGRAEPKAAPGGSAPATTNEVTR
jgi:hypothetical protein